MDSRRKDEKVFTSGDSWRGNLMTEPHTNSSKNFINKSLNLRQQPFYDQRTNTTSFNISNNRMKNM
jgi:hypothetical protein